MRAPCLRGPGRSFSYAAVRRLFRRTFGSTQPYGVFRDVLRGACRQDAREAAWEHAARKGAKTHRSTEEHGDKDGKRGRPGLRGLGRDRVRFWRGGKSKVSSRGLRRLEATLFAEHATWESGGGAGRSRAGGGSWLHLGLFASHRRALRRGGARLCRQLPYEDLNPEEIQDSS